MITEDDRLNTPDAYRKMSAAELREEREKLYKEYRKEHPISSSRNEYLPNNKLVLVPQEDSREFIEEFNKNKVSPEFLESCKKTRELFRRND